MAYWPTCMEGDREIVDWEKLAGVDLVVVIDGNEHRYEIDRRELQREPVHGLQHLANEYAADLIESATLEPVLPESEATDAND